MKLWQRLPESLAIYLLSEEGATEFLRQFPPDTAQKVGELIAAALDSEVSERMDEEAAVELLTTRISNVLSNDPQLQQAVLTFWAGSGHLAGITGVPGDPNVVS